MHDVLPLRQVVQVDPAVLEPVGVGVLAGQRRLDLVVVDQPVLGQVDQQHPARLQPALGDHLVLRDVDHAGLGGEHHQPVVADPVAARTQAVAVEGGADQCAVGEADRGGTVPGLHQRGVERVERAAGRVHLGVVLPGLRDHHHHRVRQRPAAQMQQLEHLVEGRRIGAARGADREQPLQVARDQVAGQQRLPGPHPVAVALDGVDLAVVRDQPVGVAELPGREGVGGEPRMHQRERRGDPFVGQVGEHLGQLLGGQHALVDGGARRQRREVDPGLVAGTLPQRIRQAVQGDAGGPLRVGHQQLLEDRHHLAGDGAQGARVGRHRTPAEDLEALLDGDVLDGPLGGRPLHRRLRQEGHADRVGAGLRQREGHHGPQDGVRHLQQHAGTVAGRLVRAGGAAMIEVLQGGQALGDDVVAGLPAQLRDEGNPAGVVLECGIVETLCGPCGHGHRHGLLLIFRSLSGRECQGARRPSGNAARGRSIQNPGESVVSCGSHHGRVPR